MIKNEDDMKNFFDVEKQKDTLNTKLHEGVVKVLFLKKDGTERTMNCTLNENLIPSEKNPKGTGKKQNENVVAVFDTDKNDWRSFRYDSVIYFSVNV